MDGAMFQVWNLSTGREEDDLTEMISESELRVSNSPGGSQVDQSPYTASGKPYKCKQCDNSYARQEHLDRHVRTHDPTQKLVCDQCGRSFARSDVLKRHKKLHERDDALLGSETQSIRKQAALERSAKACQACASSKVKCSGDPICQRCVSMNRLCVYPDPNNPSRGTKRGRESTTTMNALPSMSMQSDSSFTQAADHMQRLSSFVDNSDSDALSVQMEPSSSTQAQEPLGGLPPLPSLPTMTSASYGFQSNSIVPMANFDGFDSGLSSNMSGLGTFYDLATNLDSGFSSTDKSPMNSFLGGMCAISPENSGPHLSFDDFMLQTDNDMFWAKFATPPGMSTAGGVNLGQLSKAIKTPKRLMLAAGGLATRHGSPAAEGDSAPRGENASTWPMVWDPTAEDRELDVDATVEHTEPQSLEAVIQAITHSPGYPQVPKFDEDVRMSILECLRWSQMSDQEYHALYRTLSRLKLPLFDLLIGLHLQNFQRNYPVVHLPTFNARAVPAPQLLAMVALGALHCPLPGSLQLGRVLLEVSRRVVENLVNKDNRLARSLPIMQTLVLWSCVRWLGSPRFLELAEVFSGPYRTGFRRMGILAERDQSVPEGATLEQQWKIFIAHEERRRTGMACFLLESEFCTLLHLPPPFSSSELKTCLPSSEELWNAPSAETWAQIRATMQSPLQTNAMLKLINSDSPFPLPASLKLSGFGAHVLVKSLHISIYSAHQLQANGLGNAGELARTSLRRALGRLGRGKTEFSPAFAASEFDAPDSDSEFCAARVSYHLAHIATHLNLEEVDLLAGRGSSVEVGVTRGRLTNWMIANAEAGRTIALHAGRIVHSLRSHTTYGTYESSSLFYAALILYLYARSVSTADSTFNQLHQPNTIPFMLDSAQGNHDPGTWIATGGPAGIEGVEVLSESGSPARVLVALAGLLNQVGAVWRLGQVLAQVLEGVAGAEVISGG